jgi:hypothetical protein
MPESTIIPPVPVMIEQVYKSTQQLGNMVARIGQIVQINSSQQADLLNAMLEQTILLREIAQGLNIKLSTAEQLRDKLKQDRIEFLQGVLDEEGKLTEEQKTMVRNELVTLRGESKGATFTKGTAE